MSDRATVVIFPEGAFGPTNNCVGIGDVLRQRGHRVVFVRAIDRLLADRALHERPAAVSARLQASPGTAKAAGLIERVALSA